MHGTEMGSMHAPKLTQLLLCDERESVVSDLIQLNEVSPIQLLKSKHVESSLLKYIEITSFREAN